MGLSLGLSSHFFRTRVMDENHGDPQISSLRQSTGKCYPYGRERYGRQQHHITIVVCQGRDLPLSVSTAFCCDATERNRSFCELG